MEFLLFNVELATSFVSPWLLVIRIAGRLAKWRYQIRRGPHESHLGRVPQRY